MQTRKRLITIAILIIYGAILINIMVFKNMPFIRIGHMMLRFSGTYEGAANFVPFKTIVYYLLGEKGFTIAFINLAGNIVLLMPVGFLLAIIFRSLTWKKMLLPAIAAGLTIESLQALLHAGIFDIDDIILNGLGVMLGYWAFINTTKKLRMVRPKTIIITLVAVVVAPAVFYCAVFSRVKQPPLRYVISADTAKLHSADTGKVDFSKLPDPCGGTGGTGQIIVVGNNTITIKQRNGTDKLIKINKQTKIKNAAGLVPAADLKPGDRVTVVIGLNKEDASIAAAILVCNGAKRTN